MGTVKKGEWYACGESYGIRLRMSDGAVLTRDDVDCSPVSVERLVECLIGQQIDGEQLQYILEDHLVKEYSV